MKSFTYGSREYLEQEAKQAELKETLLKEAIAARLTNGQIKAEEFGTYAEIMSGAENAAEYARKQVEKYDAEHANTDDADDKDKEGDDE